MKIFGREPTVWLQGLTAVLTFFVTFGWDQLTSKQAGLIVAVVAAALSAWNAWAVKPVAPAIWTGLITSGAALLGAYGLSLNQESVGKVVLAVTAVMAIILRQAVTPSALPDNTTVGPQGPPVAPVSNTETAAGRRNYPS